MHGAPVPAPGDENWWNGFAPPGADGTCWAGCVYDGELIVAGDFTYLGGVPTQSIAAWDGVSWHALGQGIEFDGGLSGIVYDMAVHGDELVVAGSFELAGGLPASNVAGWDGGSWRAFGTEEFSHPVYSVTIWNDEVIAAGAFGRVGDRECPHLARWSGTRWEPMAATVDGVPMVLAVYDGDLIVGGISLETIDGVLVNHVARYDGVSWEALGGGLPGDVGELWVEGGKLYAPSYVLGDDYTWRTQLMVWDTETWSFLGEFEEYAVRGLLTYADRLTIGGAFLEGLPPGRYHGVMQGDGEVWTPLGEWFGGGGGVYDLVEYGGELIAVGGFSYAGTRFASRVARWDGGV